MSVRGNCLCGNLVEKLAVRKDGSSAYGNKCRTCRGRTRYGIIKGSSCEECGFVALVSSQLEIDHVDGNRDNNDKSNLKTLCCNCHAFKSHIKEDIRFIAEKNPFFGKRHSEETLNKIKAARKLQDSKRT